MKRDMELVRAVILKVEGLELPPGAFLVVGPWEPELEIEGYDANEIGHHLLMPIDGGFVDATRGLSGEFVIKGLTWNGHEFLNDIRDPEVWRKTKERTKAVAGVGLQFFWEIAKAEIKTKLGLP
jgi:hypothetical protein